MDSESSPIRLKLVKQRKNGQRWSWEWPTTTFQCLSQSWVIYGQRACNLSAMVARGGKNLKSCGVYVGCIEKNKT